MSESQGSDLERFRRLFTASEPRDLRTYLTVPTVGQKYNLGSTAPALGSFSRAGVGLWVPDAAITERAPIDFAKTFITWSEMTGGERVDLASLHALLSNIPLKNAITQVVRAMAALRAPGPPDATTSLDNTAIDVIVEPFRSRLRNRLAQGSVIHAPQLLMVLAKLILAWCPDEVSADSLVEVPIVHLLMIVADNVDLVAVDGSDDNHVPSIDELLLELSANTNFNATYREDSSMALYMRRWHEMARERPSKYYADPLDETFEREVGISLDDQTAVAVALWTTCCISQQPVVAIESYFSQVGWEASRVERVLNHIALPVDRYREVIGDEIEGKRLAWYFTTFSWYPLVRFDGFLVVLDPKLLLHRCLSRMPLIDVEDALLEAGREDEKEQVSSAFNEYSERYAVDVFERLAGKREVKRVYWEADLLRAYRGSKIADVVIDYGDAWVVVEVSTTQAARDTINAASLEGPRNDRKKIAKEALQASVTIDNIRQNEARLTGFKRANPVRFYPVVVLTEGFPSNPLAMSKIRDDLKAKGILTGRDTAPLEILDPAELDMIEGVGEATAQTLPEILCSEGESNFHADSVRNFLVGDPRFVPQRPERVNEAFRMFIEKIITRLGGDPRQHDWTPPST